MARDQRQGWVLFAAMALIFFVGVSVAYYNEAQGNPVMRGMAVDQGAGNWEGKEARFGIANSALVGNRYDGDFLRRGQFDAR